MNIFAAASAVTRVTTYEPLKEEPLLSTVRNVALCEVGMEYPLASGPKTFTPDDLLAAVASQDDPAIKSPRVWLGHLDDDRFHTGRATPAGSAEPALGKVINMRVEDDGMTLVGDIVGCPTWLARILASAYPSRSIEAKTEVKTVTGHEWDLVITDLALLGVTWPGVTTLEDLEAMFSEDGPDGVEVKEETMTVAASRAISAQVNVDDVRRAFYQELVAGNFSIGAYSWIRAMQLDPNELIVDDEDSGTLYRLSFDMKGDEVTFGEPQKVKIKYVSASQNTPENRTLLVDALTNDRTVAASWNQQAASRLDSKPQEDHGMTPDQIRALRARLQLTEEQLPDDASQDQINAALAVPSPDQSSGATPAVGPGPTNTPVNPAAPTGPGNSSVDANTPETPSPDQVPPPAEQPSMAPVVGSTAPPGMTMVPTAAWQQMQASVQTLAAAHQREEQENDGQLLVAAVRAGKVFPAQRAMYETRLKDPNTRDAFRHLLTASVEQGGLAPNLVPVEARGADPSGDLQAEAAYPAEWLPELAHRQANSNIVTEN